MTSLLGPLCPNCRVALAVSERHRIEIDYCPQCRGVWLDRGELDKIIEGNERHAVSAPPPQPMRRREDDNDDRRRGGRGKRRKSFLEELFD